MKGSSDNTEQAIIDIILRLFNVTVTDDKPLYEELDSLQVLELLTALECEGQLSSPEEIEISDLSSVHDLAEKLSGLRLTSLIRKT